VSRIIDISDVQRLMGPYCLLWATPEGEDVPFEVSREVPVLFEDKCPTSPFCPGEQIPRIEKDRKPGGPAWTYVEDGSFRLEPDRCPMGFQSKPECYRNINIIAFKRGTVPRDRLMETTAFLRAIGYTLYIESFAEEEIDGSRILIAHGPLFNFHELRVEIGPGGQRFYLVRNPYENQRPRSAVPFPP
jgi:hypothetical protein